MKVVFTVSGGADSIYLLHTQKDNYPLDQITVLHINHQTRPECSEEALFVEQHCIKLGVRFVVLKARGLFLEMPNFEDEARKERYRLFTEYAVENNITTVLTAHHQDDLIETVFLKLLRGSTNLFIPSQRYLNRDKKIIIQRPLLKIPKQEILAYLEAYKTPYINDCSNDDPKYLRNFLRLNIIPLLEQRILNVSKKLRTVAEQREKEEAFLKNYTTKKITGLLKDKQIRIKDFLKEDSIIQERILQEIMITCFKKSISLKQLQEMIKKIKRKEQKSIIIFDSLEGTILKEQGYFLIINKNIEKSLEKNELIIHNNEVYRDGFQWFVEERQGEGLRYRLEDDISLRAPKEGERIPWNKGTKKISSLLKDKKIPLSRRSEARIIQKNGNIVGVLSELYSYIIPQERGNLEEKGLYIKWKKRYQ